MAEYTYGPGSDSVKIQVFTAAAGAYRWDQAIWDEGLWSELTWQTVDCQVTDAEWSWACQRDVGVLSVSEAGSLDLATFDPDRLLDPSNVTGPFFKQVRPGTRIRILGSHIYALGIMALDGGSPAGLSPVWTGWVDELTYDVASQTGRLRCVDPIALMGQTAYRDPGLPNPLPNTLRARARRVLRDTGLDDLIEMLTEAVIDDVDPPVAPFELPESGTPPNVWTIIQNAAADALALAWIDGSGRLRFTSWGAFPVSAIALGCRPPEDDPADWAEYVSTIEFGQNAEGIRNRVVTVEGGVDTHPLEDRQSILTYGVREYRVDRAVPNRTEWGNTILDDRGDASLTVKAFEVRPSDQFELTYLLDFIRLGPTQTRLRDDQHPPLIDLEVTLIGLGVRVSPDGWVFSPITSLSRGAFDAMEAPLPSGVITIVAEAEGVIGDPSGAVTLPRIPVVGNVLLLWHAVKTTHGPTPPGFIAHPSGPVDTEDEGVGLWYWREVHAGDGPTVTGVVDAAGKVGLARLLEVENVIAVHPGPSASGDPTSPISIPVTPTTSARVMGGIVWAFEDSDGDALAPLPTNVEDWEATYAAGPVGSVFFRDQSTSGTNTVGETYDSTPPPPSCATVAAGLSIVDSGMQSGATSSTPCAGCAHGTKQHFIRAVTATGGLRLVIFGAAEQGTAIGNDLLEEGPFAWLGGNTVPEPNYEHMAYGVAYDVDGPTVSTDWTLEHWYNGMTWRQLVLPIPGASSIIQSVTVQNAPAVLPSVPGAGHLLIMVRAGGGRLPTPGFTSLGVYNTDATTESVEVWWRCVGAGEGFTSFPIGGGGFATLVEVAL